MFQRGKKKTWYFRIGSVRYSSGTNDKERAKALQRKLEQEAWDRANGFHIPTWDEACLNWLEKHQHLDSYVMNKIYARWWTEHLSGFKLNAITPDLIHELIKKHREIDLTGPSSRNSTANAYTFFAAKIIRSASNLKPEFVQYKEPRNDRWLTRQEWHTLKAQLSGDLLDICTFGLATGLREGNIIGFEWAWEHGDKAYLPPTVTKTDKPYGIPFNKTAQAVIERRRHAKVRHPVLVFTNGGKPWTCVMLLRALYRAVKRAELAHMTYHTFRHSFASWLAQMGVSDAARCRLGCWTGAGGAASRYVHFDVEDLRRFTEMLDPHLAHPGFEESQGTDGERKVQSA